MENQIIETKKISMRELIEYANAVDTLERFIADYAPDGHRDKLAEKLGRKGDAAERIAADFFGKGSPEYIAACMRGDLDYDGAQTVTKQEIANYYCAALYQGYCVGSCGGDFCPEAQQWAERYDAAETILTDLFYKGDGDAAAEFIHDHGENVQGQVFIWNPDDRETNLTNNIFDNDLNDIHQRIALKS